jgi:hypothetical protein
MDTVRARQDRDELEGTELVPSSPPAQVADPLAWEEIDAGRYMPRRIRGSFRGRVLG